MGRDWTPATELSGSPNGHVARIPQDRRLVLTAASQIKPRPVRWGWEDRMPAGHLTLIPGREGIGKSLLLTWLTSHITRGTLPGAYSGKPRPVFYCATEDSWQHTIVPRLIAAGADRDLVYRVRVETIEIDTGTPVPAQLTLPADCDLLAAEIKRLEVAMVALDPLMSAIDSKIDTHNDRDVRTALEPLARTADDTGCIMAGLAHFSKRADTDPMNLIMGSRAFSAVIRSVIAVARDPDSDRDGCVVSQVKNNLGRLSLPNLTYEIREAAVESEEGDCKTARLHFTGQSAKSVSDCLAETSDGSEGRERADCAEWLKEALASPRRTREIEEEGKARGFSQRTLYRARKKLKVHAENMQTGGRKQNEWWLSLPEETA